MATTSQHEAWYCQSDEAFLTELQVEHKTADDGTVSTYSKESGHPAVWLSEDNYKFKLSEFQQPLLDWLTQNPCAIQPKSRLNEVINHIESGLEDLSISRHSHKIKWGIRVPNDDDHTVYVWLDALTNYITATGSSADS